ncbi:MAG TPA: hypothetical protein ENI58_02835 [Nitrospirae bacterium]|nr:hypothetical protein [Nitrospirota bacterium]
MKVRFKVRLKDRERVALLAGGILAIAIISYYLFLWYGDFREYTSGRIEAKSIYLKKQSGIVAEKAFIKRRLVNVKDDLKVLETGLLPGEKAPLSAAELQRLLKEMAESLNIEIRSEKAVSPVDMGEYLGVPVEIGFNATTAKLKNMLFKIQESPLLLTVSGLKIRVGNVRNPGGLNISLTVRGLVKKEAGE